MKTVDYDIFEKLKSLGFDSEHPPTLIDVVEWLEKEHQIFIDRDFFKDDNNSEYKQQFFAYELLKYENNFMPDKMRQICARVCGRIEDTEQLFEQIIENCVFYICLINNKLE